jgi:serine/threonine protein phosphatase PrpC
MTILQNHFEAIPSVHYLDLSFDLLKEFDSSRFSSLLAKNLENNLFDFQIANAIFPDTFAVGLTSPIGQRPSVENFYTARADLALYAMFDDHAGADSASICAKTLPEAVAADQTNLAAPFDTVQQTLNDLNVDDGRTAAAILFDVRTVSAVGIGDPRILRITTTDAIRVTEDHKPLELHEFRRLNAAGIGVSFDGCVDRELALARSLGDFWCRGSLFVTPTVNRFTLTDDYVCIVLACDGLWDVVPDETAGRLVRESASAQDAAVTFRNAATALESTDNITIIVPKFGATEKPGYCYENSVEALPTQTDEPRRPPSDIPISRRRRR